VTNRLRALLPRNWRASNRGKGNPGPRKPVSKTALGVGLLVVTALVTTGLAVKPKLATFFQSGDTITAEFGSNYHEKIFPDETKVKLSGIEVGVVSSTEQTGRGTFEVSMKVDDDALDKLGPQPSARIEPKTVLGGEYAIELQQGGGTGAFPAGATIPTTRTHTPVELDRVLEALPGNTRSSLQGTVGKLDKTLGSPETRDALGNLVANAPSTLKPGGDVLNAAQGIRAGKDLPELVTNLQATASALRGRDGQLAQIVGGLDKTTATLAEQSRPLADSISAMPAAMYNTKVGLRSLDGALDRLSATAPDFQPTAQELDPLLDELDPVLKQAVPVVDNLDPLMADARPVVQDLNPTAQTGTKVLSDLRGPVLNRLNGPVMKFLNTPFHGKDEFQGTGSGMQADHKFYEELGYMISNLNRSTTTQDAQGALLNFQAGAGTQSLQGLPFSMQNLVTQIGKAVGGAGR
jgi:phospholipid/cholesterol/gamma-HCH transport system substrate-binding protein